MEHELPSSHPRYKSLRDREKIIKGMDDSIVAKAGLIAHGRGEAFDYLIGEQTCSFAETAIEASAALLLLARKPVISVNGNIAVLCPHELVCLSRTTGAPLEINLFYRTTEREKAILDILENAGGGVILGLDPEHSATITEIHHKRRHVDTRGIYTAETVLVPLEDGDRTEALRAMGKNVITIDLNPVSRTSRKANISIIDNVVRAMPLLIEAAEKLKNAEQKTLEKIIAVYNNEAVITAALRHISTYLDGFYKEGDNYEQH